MSSRPNGGDIDGDDATLAGGYAGRQLGWTNLSYETVANRLGYAGYHKDVNLDISHVRHRVLEPHLGRWTRRDPLGYVDGMSLYQYVGSRSISSVDSRGLTWEEGCGSSNPTAVTKNCQCCLDILLEEDFFKHMWEKILATGNCSKAKKPVCAPCNDPKEHGNTDKDGNITICTTYKPFNTPTGFDCNLARFTVRHELVHQLDQCEKWATVDTILKTCKGAGQSTCEQWVCSELRAYAFSRECDEPDGPRLVECRQKHPNCTREQCIKAHAIESITRHKGRCPGGSLLTTVDKLYACCVNSIHNPYNK